MNCVITQHIGLVTFMSLEAGFQDWIGFFGNYQVKFKRPTHDYKH